MNKMKLQSGMSLLELMVAMTIGIFLVGGAFVVFLSASDSRRTNEDVSRMQENARYALDTIKPDIRMAGYWGLTRELSIIDGYNGTPTQLAALASSDCASRWYIDLANTFFASNDTNPYAATCIPAASYQAGTDVLVLRHAAPQASATLADDTIYVRSDAGRGEVFNSEDGFVNTYSAQAQNHRLVTHAYYIRPYTFAVGDGLPSLRRLVLDEGPAIVDEEVIPGVEDLQVQYGVDDDGDGSVNRYLDPDSAIGGGQVLAVRLWIMTRAPTDEVGYTDSNTYVYASKSVAPADNFRRLLITSTVQLRNMIPVPTP